MKTLIAIGYWHSQDETDLPDINNFLGSTWEKEKKKLVAEHLSKGLKLHSWKGYSWCRFNCGIPYSEMGNHDLTDGKYVWPEGLHHYVEKHDIIFPAEFIEHVIQFNAFPDQLNPYETQVDFSWWKKQKAG